MGDMSCGIFSTKNHTIFEQDGDTNNVDVSSGYNF